MSRLSFRPAPWAAAIVLGTVVASLSAPTAADTPKSLRTLTGSYEMPFPCGQAWTGKTRSGHSPSSKAIDWNRTDDEGDQVVASSAGTVAVANETSGSGYGHYVQISHLNGEATLYAHLSDVAVSVGQTVDQGVVIGSVGSTGNSTGPHLHYEQKLGRVVQAAVFGGQPFVYDSTPTSRNCVDVPLAANMAGSAASERVVFRRKTRATFRIRQAGAARTVVSFGRPTDDPVLGDWDGDGVANVGVRRPAESVFYLSTPAGATSFTLGIASDRPIAGDWNGDRVTDLGVWRASTATFYLRAGDGSLTAVGLGDTDDTPVTGDWNGDVLGDVGVYDPATSAFTLRHVAADGLPSIVTIPFGAPGDLPVTGDWDGNGLTDLGVWRPSTGSFISRRAPAARLVARSVTEVRFGEPRG